MRRVVAVLILLVVGVYLSAETADFGRFGPRSIFTACAGILELLNGDQVDPLDIEKKVNYKAGDTNSVDYYIPLIAKAYDLKVNSIELNSSNQIDVANAIANVMTNEGRVVVTYEKDNLTHSAMLFGTIFDSNKILNGYVINDAGADQSDVMEAKTLTSDHWKLKMVKAYWFK